MMPMETVFVFQILSQSGSSISPAASASASLRDGAAGMRRAPAWTLRLGLRLRPSGAAAGGCSIRRYWSGSV